MLRKLTDQNNIVIILCDQATAEATAAMAEATAEEATTGAEAMAVGMVSFEVITSG